MKNYILFILLSLTATPLIAQNQETLISGSISSGGFGGPVIKFTSINGTSSVLTGGRGGWIMRFPSDNSFVLGGGGYGLVTDIPLNNVTYAGIQPLYLNLGYGGLDLEYVHHSGKLIHFTIETMIGAGTVSYSQRDHEHLRDAPRSSFFLFEPSINLIINITPFFRLGGGIGYRLTSGANLPGTSDKQLSGLAGILTLKFGKF